MSRFELAQVFSRMAKCTNCPLGAENVGGCDLPRCLANNEPVRFFDPHYDCPIGLWKHQPLNYTSGIVWLARSDPALEVDLDARFERLPNELKWRVPQKGIIGKLTSFVSSVTSSTATEEVINQRLTSCRSCPALVKTNEGSFCGACGCGKWQLANLDGGPMPKLMWARLDCPLKRPGFSNS